MGDEPTKQALELSRTLVEQAETALVATQDLADQANAAAVALTQRDFFDDGSFGMELAAIDKPGDTRHGKYTGEQLARNVELRDKVVTAHVQGVGVRRMVKEFRAQGYAIGENSVLALLANCPALVATEKKRLSTALGGIIILMTDSLRERLIAGTMKPSSVDVAIMIDKRANVDGEAGLVIEHRITLPSAEDFTKRLEEMKRAKVTLVQDAQSTENDEKTQ